MKTGPSYFLLLLAAILVAALAGVFFFFTRFPYFFPGDAASEAAGHLGVGIFNPVQHQLWGALARLATSTSPFPTWLTLNGLSVVCGALSVGLVYFITGAIRHNKTTEEFMSIEGHPKWIGHLSALFAAAFLCVCVPFWISSTHGLPVSFHILHLLICVALVASCQKEETGTFRLYLACFLYGVGLTEYVGFVLGLPLFIMGVASGFYHRYDRLPLAALFGGAVFGLMGMSWVLIAAQNLLASPSAEWMSVTDYQDAVWKVITVSFNRFRTAIPELGWLQIGLTTLVPGLIVLVPKRLEHGRSTYGSYLLHLVCTVIGVVVLWNIVVSPWELFRLNPLFVAPYVFMAIWMGYLAGYWFLAIRSRRRLQSAVAKFGRFLLRLLWFPAAAAIIAGSIWFNHHLYNPDHAALYKKTVQSIIDAQDGREFLLTREGLEDVYHLEAASRGEKLRAINIALANTQPYRKFLQSFFPDEPRYRALAQIGAFPMISEWLSSDPYLQTNVTSTSGGDLWYSAGLEPEASGWLETTRMENGESPEALYQRQVDIWNTIDPDIAGHRTAVESDFLLNRFSQWFLTHSARLANNTGFELQSRDRPDLAAKCYERALSYDPENLSALLNIGGLQHASQYSGVHSNALADALRLSEQTEMKNRLRRVPLSGLYGYVHLPDAFLSRGFAWAAQGNPLMAIREFERALEMDRSDRNVRFELAKQYLKVNRTHDSQRVLAGLAKENSDDPRPLIMLARNAIRDGNYSLAQQCISRLDTIPEMDSQARFERSGLELMRGNTASARAILEDLVNEPDGMTDIQLGQCWASLALIALREDDEEEVDVALSQLSDLSKLPANFRMLQAEVYKSKNRLRDARRLYEQITKAEPNNELALEQLLRLDVIEANRHTARPLAEKLLKLNPNNAYANYIRGTLHAASGYHDLAVASFRASLGAGEKADPGATRDPEVLNALAWSLQSDSEYDESLMLSKEAIQLNDRLSYAWHTAGVIHLKREEYPEALSCLQESLRRAPGHANYLIDLALLLEQTDHTEDAKQIAADLVQRQGELDPSNRDELYQLRFRLNL